MATSTAPVTNTRQLKDNLSNYEAQLHQVEAGLTNEPDSEELLKLKEDLTAVIGLTRDLLELVPEPKKRGGNFNWKPGDPCQAIWSEKGKYYDAVVDMIGDDGDTCTVTFDGYSTTEVCKLADLRQCGWDDMDPLEAAKKRRHGLQGGKKSKLKKMEMRELKKKKALKKQARLQEIEEVRETEKSRWKNFTDKSSKQRGGPISSKQKRSIFAVPDSINGKVGVGTCNIGGQPMTDYSTPKNYVK